MSVAEAKMIDPSYNRARKLQRMEQEEKEIEELMKQAAGGNTEDDELEQSGEDLEETSEEENKETKAKEAKSSDEGNDESKLSSEEKTFKKRYADLQRHFQKEKESWKKELETIQNQGNEIAPPKSDEELEKWIKQYPEVASYVSTMARKQAQTLISATDSKVEQLEELRIEADIAKAERQIMEKHDDFAELRESEAFHDWADDQPSWVQNALYENQNDAKSVIRVIDLYKSDKGLTKESKKRNVEAAASSVSKNTNVTPDLENTGKKWSESKVNKLSMSEYEKHEEEILKAMTDGKFVYDLSGGAR